MTKAELLVLIHKAGLHTNEQGGLWGHITGLQRLLNMLAVSPAVQRELSQIRQELE